MAKQKTSEDLQAEVATLQEQLAKAQDDGAKRKEQVKDLTKKLKVQEATKGSKLPTVEVGEQHFVFTGPKARVLGKGVVSADDAAKDAALCADLVKKGSGWLKLVNIK